ncbi:MAG: glycine zipper 2TM domain-containing protein [Gemmatimonadaceae bacterium]|nr:glycine zipper 2TM domain-containing protein [Gemmatimonadaceae bacterium]
MRFKYLIAVPAIFLAAACKGNDAKVDDALNSDLSLAAQSQTAPLDSISGVERGYTTGTTAAPVARTSTRRTTSAPVRRTSTARRTSSSSSGSSSGSTSSGTYYPPAPATKVVKNTKRDAAIGATAGAVIGAATSRNRVKGAVIGGAAGAILGAVIGNNVDKKTVPVDR